jgi:hypothetical protein
MLREMEDMEAMTDNREGLLKVEECTYEHTYKS